MPEKMNHRKNNFDFLRLIFASFVIITHSYTLSAASETDILYELSNGRVSFSYIGVQGFFVISGYLIFQSLQRSEQVIDYFWKRILRLFPALFVMLVLTVLLAPFVYHSDIPLLRNTSYITYLPNNLSLYRTQYTIDGVFENNPFGNAINGSLWTIPYEFTMYVLLAVLIITRRNTIATRIILASTFLLILTGIFFYHQQVKQLVWMLLGEHLFDLGAFFIAGSLLAAMNIEKIKWKAPLLALFSILAATTFSFEFFGYVKYFILPILFILFGLNPIKYIDSIGEKIGDLSYGIYIYGFPVQQTLMYYFRFNYAELMLSSLAVSYILAYFSWHLIEKKALTLKKLNPITLFIEKVG
jgi:peptidoglycan/LPS O-acetylase OafA/YrhL